MPSASVDTGDLGRDACGTEGVSRQRKNRSKQSDGASSDHSDTPAYTEEQYEAVKRYISSVQSGTVCTFSRLDYASYFRELWMRPEYQDIVEIKLFKTKISIFVV